MQLSRPARFDYDPQLERMETVSPKEFGMSKEYLFEKQAGMVEGVPYFSDFERQTFTIHLSRNSDGKLFAHYSNGYPLINETVNFAVLDDPTSHNEGKEILVAARDNFWHSNFSSGKGLKYSGILSFNEKARLSSFEDVSLQSGHYTQPSTEFVDLVTNDPAAFQKAKEFEQYVKQKFADLIDEPMEIGDNSTVAYGEPDQADRMASDFPDEISI
jgi:hypothetical protein